MSCWEDLYKGLESETLDFGRASNSEQGCIPDMGCWIQLHPRRQITGPICMYHMYLGFIAVQAFPVSCLFLLV